MAIACCSSPSTMYLREVYAVHEFCKSSTQKKSVFLREEGSASGGELLALGFVNVGEREIEFVQGVENDAGNDEAREPFVVRHQTRSLVRSSRGQQMVHAPRRCRRHSRRPERTRSLFPRR